MDDGGMHQDFQIQDIDDVESDSSVPKVLNKSQPTTDTNHFFKKAPIIPGSNKGHTTCVCCQCVSFLQACRIVLIIVVRNGTDGCPKKMTNLVDEVSTLHRHMAAHHEVCFISIHAHILTRFDRMCTRNGRNTTTST